MMRIHIPVQSSIGSAPMLDDAFDLFDAEESAALLHTLAADDFSDMLDREAL